jgi:hypothetical protein
MHDTDLTVSQRIILAADRLESQGHTPMSAEALIVAAWQECPRTFGLKGFADQHPDSNRVLACIMGERGLARRGWLEKCGQKLYSLSRQGKDEARRLKAGDEAPKPESKRRNLERIKAPKALTVVITGLLSSPAYRRFEEGMKREITYRDACRFWGLSEAASGDAVLRTLNLVPQTIKSVESLLVNDAVELSNGQSVNASELDNLTGLHSWLCDQFARHLDQQRDKKFRRIA